MEFGPRALGAAASSATPARRKMQSVMNLKIKFRECFRPFAPAVLKEKVSEYFEARPGKPLHAAGGARKAGNRREMTGEEQARFGLDKLHVVRSGVPAITHVDYSARVQTVDREVNPSSTTIEALGERHGCPLVINTSFNVRGEPIVCSPEDAYLCFMRTNMDYLVMGPFPAGQVAAEAPVDRHRLEKEIRTGLMHVS